jgi:hypothetical protein
MALPLEGAFDAGFLDVEAWVDLPLDAAGLDDLLCF